VFLVAEWDGRIENSFKPLYRPAICEANINGKIYVIGRTRTGSFAFCPGQKCGAATEFDKKKSLHTKKLIVPQGIPTPVSKSKHLTINKKRKV
jgi:hypothetical protein